MAIQLSPLTVIEGLPNNRFNGIGELLRLTGDLDPTGQVGKVIGIGAGDIAAFITLDQSATVASTGATYTTLADAIDAGETNITIVGTATETRDTLFVSSVTLTINPNINWDLGDYRLRYISENVELTWLCYGNVTWSPTTTKNLVDTDLTAFLADTVNGSNILTNISIDTSNMRVGQKVGGPGINGGTQITSIDSVSQVTLNQNANADQTQVELNGPGQTGGQNLYLLQGWNINMQAATADDCGFYNGLISFVLVGLGRILVPNQHGNGFKAGSAIIEFKKCTIAFVSVSSAGDNCYGLYEATGEIDELVFVGGFHPTEDLFNFSNGKVAAIKYLDIAGPATINGSVGDNSAIGSVTSLIGSSINITVPGNNVILQNATLLAGNVVVTGNGFVSSNNRSTGTLDISDPAASGGDYTSTSFDQPLVIGGDGNKFDLTCRFVGGVTNNGTANVFAASVNPEFDGVSPEEAQLTFGYGDASPEFIVTVPAGKTVYNIQLVINEIFDGSNPSLTVGDDTLTVVLMTAAQNDPALVGSYSSSPSYTYGTATQVKLFIDPGAGATQGSGVVIVSMSS